MPLFLAFFLAFFLNVLAGPNLAFGAGIQVLRDEQTILFPQKVIFTLEAQSEHDILEVQLHYRSSNSRIWAYNYPEFDPGQRVVAQFSLPTAGANYLPPGSRIEYSYKIIDAQGGELETPPQVIEYTDLRYDWQETRIGPLTLLHHDVSQRRVDSLAARLGPEIARVGNLLQLNSLAPVRGYLYNSPQETEGAFPHQSRTITAQQVFHGFAFPENGIFVGIGLEPGLIVHETTHLLFAQAMASRRGGLPSWLDEGFASYMEPGAHPYSGRSLRHYGVPLRSMRTISGTPQDIYIFYFKAESVVAFLIESQGEAKFQAFLARLNQGTGIESAMLQVYGFGIDQLEVDWSASATGRTAQSPRGGIPSQRPSPIILINSLLLGGLVLAVTVLVAGRFIWRRLHPVYDPEEGLQPWEDPDYNPDHPDHQTFT